jgi:hypothetical protein
MSSHNPGIKKGGCPNTVTKHRTFRGRGGGHKLPGRIALGGEVSQY